MNALSRREKDYGRKGRSEQVKLDAPNEPFAARNEAKPSRRTKPFAAQNEANPSRRTKPFASRNEAKPSRRTKPIAAPNEAKRGIENVEKKEVAANGLRNERRGR